MRAGAAERATAIPGMRRIVDAALGFVTRARPGSLGPIGASNPISPMAARSVIQFDVALPPRNALIELREQVNERQRTIVFVIDRARVAFALIDHRREFSHASAERLSEVGVLRRFT